MKNLEGSGNPYANVEQDLLKEEKDKIVRKMSAYDYADVTRSHGEHDIRNECHKVQVWDWEDISQIIRRIWIRVSENDPCKLPADFFNAQIY